VFFRWCEIMGYYAVVSPGELRSKEKQNGMNISISFFLLAWNGFIFLMVLLLVSTLYYFSKFINLGSGKPKVN
jgi:hypothetical protein